MDLLIEIGKSVLLGIVQGISEFLPISSDGHLELAKHILGYQAGLLFTILLHLGTLGAVFIAFRKKIGALIAGLFRIITRRKKEGDALLGRLWILLIISTVATIPVALFFNKVNDYVNANPKLIGLCFLVTAAALICTVFFKGQKGYDRTGPLAAIAIGVAQGVAVLSGVSRSGMTISTALGTGMARENAGEYSFLLAIPAILAAFVFDIRDAGNLLLEVSIPALIAGVIAAFGTGLLAIFLLLKIIRSGKLYFFSLYLVPLGILTLIFA